MYQVFLGYLPLPIAPARINTVVNGRNETIELFNGQEVNIIKPKGLTDISFEFLIPHQNYPFATLGGQLLNIVGNTLGNAGYSATETAIYQYLEYLKSGKTTISGAIESLLNDGQTEVTKGEPFQFIVANVGNTGTSIKSNIKVTLESYEIIEDAEEYGLDVCIAVNLKQYVPYSTKILNNNGKITKTRGK